MTIRRAGSDPPRGRDSDCLRAIRQIADGKICVFRNKHKVQAD